jgi:hypothetical protein
VEDIILGWLVESKKTEEKGIFRPMEMGKRVVEKVGILLSEM